MRIVTMAAQKGGAQKSTLCRHLAVAAMLSGYRSAILDTDQQGTVRDWGESRQGKPPEVTVELSTNVKHLEATLTRLKAKGTEILFIDTPGSLSGPVAANSIQVADLVLVPMRPTPEDINALAPLLRLLDKKHYQVVLSQCPTTTARPKTEAFAYLKENGIPALETAVHLKGVIPETHINGTTVLELTGLTAAEQKSADEFNAIFQWVERDLKLAMRKSA